MKEDDTVTIMGTLKYMPPEAGKALQTDDHFVKHGKMWDVFSLGCVLYWLKVGEDPFTDSDIMNYGAEILDSALTKSPLKSLHFFLGRMLDADKRNRPRIEEVETVFCTSLPSPYLRVFEIPPDVKIKEWTEFRLQVGLDPSRAKKFPLHFAVESNDKRLVRRHLRDNDINGMDDCGLSPLHVAVLKNYPPMTKMLLSLGANVNVVDPKYNVSPLWLASYMGHYILVKQLLADRNVDRNIRDKKFGSMALHVAAQKGHHDVVKKLNVNNAAKVSRLDGCTPLHMAVINGHSDVVEEILKKYPEMINSVSARISLSPLWLASLSGQEDAVSSLIKMGARTKYIEDKTKFNALELAAYLGHSSVMEVMPKPKNVSTAVAISAAVGNYSNLNILKPAASVPVSTKKSNMEIPSDKVNDQDEEGRTALYRASNEGNANLVDKLLQMEANAELKSDVHNGKTPLQVASYKGHLNVIKLLVEKGRVDIENVNKSGETALYLAAKYNHVAVLTYLIHLNANINHQDRMGKTPLWEASFRGHLETVKLLLFFGADAQIEANEAITSTPLHVAAQEGRENVVKVLIEGSNPDLNARDRKGCTPFYRAVINKQIGTMQILCKHKANIDQWDEEGKSPVWQAASRGFDEVLEFLLDVEANLENGTVREGVRPLHTAAENGHLKCVELLVKSGSADISAVNFKGQTAMQIASNNGRENICKFLQEIKREEPRMPSRRRKSESALNQSRPTSLNIEPRGKHNSVITVSPSRKSNSIFPKYTIPGF